MIDSKWVSLISMHKETRKLKPLLPFAEASHWRLFQLSEHCLLTNEVPGLVVHLDWPYFKMIGGVECGGDVNEAEAGDFNSLQFLFIATN